MLGGVAVFAQYNEQDIRDYIEQYADVAVKKMHEYKIPASITVAQGIFESACGKSRLATEGNNHFGIKCHEWDGDTILPTGKGMPTSSNWISWTTNPGRGH